MKRERWILLHEENGQKISYDFSSGQYLQYNERNQMGKISLWLFFQPLVIAALEAGQRVIGNNPLNIRRAWGIALLAAGMLLCSVLWEKYLSDYFRALKKSAIVINDPGEDRRESWAQEAVVRLRFVRNIGMICGVPFAGFLILFLWTGIPVTLTLALAFYLIGYLIIGSARPGLLRRYIRNYKEL
ncbi:MAG: hypothetical protein E7239_09985 [Sarcina sp.]|nr:hypothetical protein [Sarcina sp.]